MTYGAHVEVASSLAAAFLSTTSTIAICRLVHHLLRKSREMSTDRLRPHRTE